jgi:hypothetical protein
MTYDRDIAIQSVCELTYEQMDLDDLYDFVVETVAENIEKGGWSDEEIRNELATLQGTAKT